MNCEPRPPRNFEEVVDALIGTPRHCFGHIEGLFGVFLGLFPEHADWEAAGDALKFIELTLEQAREQPDGNPFLTRLQERMDNLRRVGFI